MANCTAELNVNHFWINVKDENDVFQGLLSLLEVDADLTENEEHFRDDTIELGFENEAERIVKEELKDKEINDIEGFKQVVRKVAEYISSQEFFGDCKLSFVATDTKTVVIAFATGGN